MNLLYVSSSPIPSTVANSVQVMRMCAAFRRLGHEVTLVAAPGDGAGAGAVEDVRAWYGIDEDFAIDTTHRSTRRGIGMLLTARRVGDLARRTKAALAYGRDPIGLLGAASAGVPVVYEVHHPPATPSRTRIERRLLRHPAFVQVVAITGALADRYRSDHPGTTVVVAHDAADDPGVAADEPRPARPILGYCGSLRPGKGAELAVELGRRLPDVDVVVVGGSPAEADALRADAPPNVLLVGAVAPAAVRDYLRHFTVALAPYGSVVHGAAGSVDLAPWMSPLKVYEYLAAGLPVLASDLPALREVLEPGVNAVLAPPGDAEAWAAAARALLDDHDRRAAIAGAARRTFLEGLTWDRRAAAVLDRSRPTAEVAP